MKAFALLISLFFAVNSIAVAPYGVKGQNQSTIYPNVNQVPNNQVTNLGGINSLFETGNTNILANPSFEHSTYSTSWSLTGTGTFSAETTKVIHGKKALKIVLSASTPSVVQSSTLYAAQYADGVQGLAMVRVWSDIPLSVCSVQAGTVSTTNCVVTAGNSLWGLYKVPFIFGATSNGISIASASSQTGTVYIDDAFVGAVDLKTDIAGAQTGAVTTAGVANCSWSGSTVLSGTTLTSFAADADCGVATATGIATAPATKIPAITLPAGTGPIIDFRLNGTFRTDKATATNAACFWELYDGTNQYPLNIPAIAGASGNQAISVPQLGTRVVLSAPLSAAKTYEVRYAANASPGSCSIPTDSATISNFQIAVTSYPSSGTQIYSASCGANCVDTYTAEMSTTGVISNENVDFINGNCSLSTDTFTCPLVSGLVTTKMNCNATNTDGNSWQVNYMKASSSTTNAIFKTFSNSGASIAGSLILRCSKTGADFTASRTIVGSFNEVNTTPGVSKPVTYSINIGTTGAAQSNETGDWINGNCTNATPQVCTFQSTAFASGSSPECWYSWANNSVAAYTCFHTVAPTSSSVSIRCSSGASADVTTSLPKTLFCRGIAP